MKRTRKEEREKEKKKEKGEENQIYKEVWPKKKGQKD